MPESAAPTTLTDCCGDVIAVPVGSVAEAVAVESVRPASTSDCPTTAVAVQDTDAPGARVVVCTHEMAAVATRLSWTATACSVVVPVLVMVYR